MLTRIRATQTVLAGLACMICTSADCADPPIKTIKPDGTPNRPVVVGSGLNAARSNALFPLGVYWPHGYAGTLAANEKVEIDAYTDRILGVLKTNHCNFVWLCGGGDQAQKTVCELASKHGIQVGLSPEVAGHPGRTRAAATPRAASLVARETFKTFGQVKGCWGYVLDDEPRIPAQPYLEAIERELLRLDPTRPVTTMFRRTEAAPAIQRHDTGIVTVDSCPFGAAGNPNLPNTPEAGGGTLLQLEATTASRPLAKVVEDFSTPGMAVSFERAEVGLAPNRWGTELQHAAVPVQGAGKLPATVTCGVVGGWNLEPSGPLYVVYRSEGDVRLSFSDDGREFTPAASGAFNAPILIPKGTAQVRFSLGPEAKLFRLCIIGTEVGNGQ